MKPFILRTVTLNCRYCGPIPFSPMTGESNEDALKRHYASPMHHFDHSLSHIHYLGEPCKCGIDQMLWMDELLSQSLYGRVGQ